MVFFVTSESVDVIYKTTDHYSLSYERFVSWNDSAFGIKWPVQVLLSLLEEDRQGIGLVQGTHFKRIY